MPKVKHYRFQQGFGQDTDDRLLDPGVPRAIENLVVLKKGRLGMRKDYDALAMTTYNGTLVATDVLNFDGTLCAFGDTGGRGFAVDIFSFTGSNAQLSGANWSGTNGNGFVDIRIGAATNVRNMGRLPTGDCDIDIIDVAATAGHVALIVADKAFRRVYVHIFRSDTGATLLVEKYSNQFDLPRVVAIGGVFYYAGLNSGNTAVQLRSINPTTQTSSTLVTSTMFPAAGNIVAFDMKANDAGTEIIAAIARTTPATEIRRVDTAGATQQTITGPATLMAFVTVQNDGTNIYFVDVADATDVVRLSTYAVSGGALVAGPTAVFGASTTQQQPSIQVFSSTQVRIAGQLVGGIGQDDIHLRAINKTTHALGSLVTWLTSKLMSKTLSIQVGGAVSTQSIFAGYFEDDDATNFLAQADAQLVIAASERHTASPTLRQLPAIGVDASVSPTRYYWPQMTRDAAGEAVAFVSEFNYGTAERFQCASIGGHLYCAMGQALVTGGVSLVESGFPDTPTIWDATPEVGGSLTPSSLYLVAVVEEWTDEEGARHQTEPSEFFEVSLGAGDSAIDVVFMQAHTARANLSNQSLGAALTAVVYCSQANGKTLTRAVSAVLGFATFGGLTSLTILGPDSAFADEEALYTQAQRPLASTNPLPGKYIWSSKDRLLLGGLPQPSMLQESLDLFIGEPIQWSQDIGFLTQLRGNVTAVAVMDERRFVCTAREIVVVPGEGVDADGNGSFGPPVKLPSDGGCIDWRSLVECSIGLFFQLDTDKIYIIPRGGGAPVWIGLPVQDVLALFPVITSASLITKDQTVRFTCNNTGATDGIILIYDIRHQQWITEGPFGNAHRAGCEYQGRMVRVNGTGSSILQQRTAHPPAAFINNAWRSGTIYPFGEGNQGRVNSIVWYGEFRGNATLTCVLTFFDASTGGTTTETLTATTFATPTFAVGQLISHKFSANQLKCEGVRVDFQVTALAGAASEGLVYHYFGLETTDSNRAALKSPARMS